MPNAGGGGSKKPGELYKWKSPDWKEREKEQKWGDPKPEDLPVEKGHPKLPTGSSIEVKIGKPGYSWKATGEVWRAGDDKAFVSFLHVEASTEAPSMTSGPLKVKASAKAKVTGSVVHGQIDISDRVRRLIAGGPVGALPPQASRPQAARVGDLTAHGAPLTGGPGSPNVFIGGKPAWRANLDLHVCPMMKGTAPHGSGSTLPGSTTVKINGAPAARAGDSVMEAAGGPDSILAGCTTVVIGDAPPPPPPTRAPAKPGPPWVVFESSASGDIGYAEAKAEAKGEVDVRHLQARLDVDAGAETDVVRAEIPLKLRLRIPNPITSACYYLGLGVTFEGTLLGAGLKGDLHGGFNRGVNPGKLWDSGGGLKVGAGLAGVGVKWSIDIDQ